MYVVSLSEPNGTFFEPIYTKLKSFCNDLEGVRRHKEICSSLFNIKRSPCARTSFLARKESKESMKI